MSGEPFEVRDGMLNLLNAAMMTPSQEAAFSEGFCEPCRQPLGHASCGAAFPASNVRPQSDTGHMDTPTVEEHARAGLPTGLLRNEVTEHGTALIPLLSAEAANAALNDGKSLLRLGTQIASACSRDKITSLWAATDAGHRLLAAALIAAPDTLAAHRLGDRAATVAVVDAVAVTALALDRAAAVLKRTGVGRVHAITIEVYSTLPTPHLDSIVSIGSAPVLRRAQ